MLKKRVIPTLLLKEGGLVKTTKFKNPKYIGDPINAIKIFNEKEVDELIVIDIDASKNSAEPDYKLIEQFSSECFMPLCYGGGIKNVQQAKKIFSLGVEKISIQDAFYDDIKFLKSLVEQFGSQSIVASIDVKRTWTGKHKLYSARYGSFLRIDLMQFLIKIIDLGVGEILINSVDRDGTQSGIERDLIGKISRISKVPIISAGGVASLEDIKLVSEAGASGISVGAFFVFKGPHRAVLISYPSYSDLAKLFK